MSDDTRPCTSDEPADRADVERLRQDVAVLRHRIEHEVRTRRVVVVDDAGVDRIRLSANGDACRLVLLAADGFERLTLEGETEQGALRIAGRSEGEGPGRVDVFAIDPEDDRGAYVGVELIDAGNSVAGFTVLESSDPRTWIRRP